LNPTRHNWNIAFAKQGLADFEIWELLEGNPVPLPKEYTVPPCQKLHFLQMACEKLCKSHLIEISSVEPEKHQDSHGYTAKNLTMIVRQELSYLSNPPTNGSYLLSQCQPLAREIELLHPSMDKGGKRRDNCEYPWVHGGVLRVPLTCWTAATPTRR
jgi:hypothetical protein